VQTETFTEGEWYHCVDCSHCGTPVYAFHARAGSDERLPGPGLFSVRCSKCGYRDLYKPNAFTARRYSMESDAAVAH
jgi:DNA-directed RNA polymerase subunit RPC12/RpoP